jgi:hypothetical protein
MLADPSEAAVRASRPSTPEELEQIIDGIFAARVADGQLDECDLTISDLSVAREAFASVLRGMFHPRVRYPQPEPGSDVTKPDAPEAEVAARAPASQSPPGAPLGVVPQESVPYDDIVKEGTLSQHVAGDVNTQQPLTSVAAAPQGEALSGHGRTDGPSYD